MPNFVSPVSSRGLVTRWIVESPWSRMTARVTRTIDTDGDEEWRVEIKRGDTWTPAPKMGGRNKAAADRIRRELDCVFLEVEELEAAKGEASRFKLDVGGTRHDERDDVGAGLTGPGFHFQWPSIDR